VVLRRIVSCQETDLDSKYAIKCIMSRKKINNGENNLIKYCSENHGWLKGNEIMVFTIKYSFSDSWICP
jgi:hypothetical protein